MCDTMTNRRIDGVLGNIAFNTKIIIIGSIFLQTTALQLHFVGSLPGTNNHLADAPHGLRV